MNEERDPGNDGVAHVDERAHCRSGRARSSDKEEYRSLESGSNERIRRYDRTKLKLENDDGRKKSDGIRSDRSRGKCSKRSVMQRSKQVKSKPL